MTSHIADALRMFMGTFSSILGAIILISIVLPWFLIGVFAILVVYIYAAAFYRASARELKVHFCGYVQLYVDLTILFLSSALVNLQKYNFWVFKAY